MQKRILDMPAPVMGLITQSTLEDTGNLGYSIQEGDTGCEVFSVSISYTLWRNPADRGAPVNLAELDDETRAALDEVPPWPRPQWLIDRVQAMRYPRLWEAVRTTWNRDAIGASDLRDELVGHANHVLDNQYEGQEQDTSTPHPFPRTPRITDTSVDRSVTVIVDGAVLPAAQIDTDPLVYAIGALVGPNTVVSAVLPRSEMKHVQIAFETRQALVSQGP